MTSHVEKGRHLIMMHKHIALHAAHGLSFDERRLIYAALSKVDGRIGRRGTFLSTITITAQEYAEIFNVSINHAYQDIKQASEALYDRSIEFIEKLTKNKMIRSKYRWLCSIQHHDGEGFVSLSFNPQLQNFFTELKNNYTIYDLEDIHGLKSVYSQRFAEIIFTYKKTGWWKISVEEFCKIMEAPESCRTTFQNLKRVVINRIVEDLRKKNWIVEWEGLKGKSGKKIVDLSFKFKKNPQLALEI